MRSRSTQVGFSQRIRLEWLEKTANLMLAGSDDGQIYSTLQELLEDKVSIGANPERGNREKVITILMRIWVRVPSDLRLLQNDALRLFSQLPRDDHLVLHWGMAMAAYPFWASVASQVGRLLRLQGTASASQVQRRMREQYGERDTVSRAARRVLRSLIDWQILKETNEQGLYVQRTTHDISDVQLIAWLVEALLHADPNGSAALRTAMDSTSLFPFRLERISGDALVKASGRLDLLRHGLDQDLIMLRRDDEAGLVHL